ncbi:MAG TPA: ribonuclease P protein component [Burkholderiales bacterium]|nr:ribonuclease P protein component [Burkholderiales bacterium]
MPGKLGRSGLATIGSRFGLGAERRLSNKADFERLLREGARQSRSGYTFFTLMRTSGPARLGVLVTRRHAAKAVVRNGLKRCIREAFRLEHAGLGAMDVLVRPPFGARPGAAMLARLRKLFVELPR